MTRSNAFSITIALLFAISGCSGPSNDADTGTTADTRSADTSFDTSGPDADASETGPTDTEAPELRDVSAAIQGEFSSQVDLNGDDDVVRIVPVAAETEFTVFATDDETDTDKLTVEVVDAEGNALETIDETLNNGLWKTTVELAPGTRVSVTVTDEAGNTAETSARLVIPTREEALVDDWQTRDYSDDDQSITARSNLEFYEDGTWDEETPNETFSGTYQFDGDRLQTTMNTISGEDVVPERRFGTYYVDETYFQFRPWTRSGDGGDSVVGTWERSFEVHHDEDGGFELTREVSETLEFQEVDGDDDTWTLTRSGTDYSDDGETDIDESESGTWTVIENESYAGNYGDFLQQTTTHRDGAELDSLETVTELYRLPLDKLLISPYLRSPESD